MSRVVIYDSGVGGLSIYQEIQASNPEFELIFVSDNQAYPYGTKDSGSLLERVQLVADAVVKRYQPDVLVLACNTASTVCLPQLRAALDVSVVGVVPAIKPAAALSKSKVIGLLATPATVKRAYTEQLIQDFAADVTVIRVGSSDLVNLAEAKLAEKPVDMVALADILKPITDVQELDVLVLACTHFPLLKPEIEIVLSNAKNAKVILIDSGAAIAKQVARISQPNMTEKKAQNRAAFTAEIESKGLANALKKIGLTTIDVLSL